jgi:hypothetical protein
MAGQGTEYLDKSTGELKEGNNPFYQFYKHNLKIIRWMAKEYPKALEVFLFIVENMDKKNALVISQTTLAEALDIGRTTVFRCIKFLQEKKCLAVYKSGNTNVYAINADIVWQKSHADKVFAKFDAKVYLSKSEQDESITPINVKTELVGHASVQKGWK